MLRIRDTKYRLIKTLVVIPTPTALRASVLECGAAAPLVGTRATKAPQPWALQNLAQPVRVVHVVLQPVLAVEWILTLLGLLLLRGRQLTAPPKPVLNPIHCNPKGWQRVAGGRNGVETSGLGEKKPVHPEGVTEGRADADWQFQA